MTAAACGGGSPDGAAPDAGPDTAPDADVVPPTGATDGELRFAGCTPDPAAVKVRFRRVQPVQLKDGRAPPVSDAPAAGEEITATVTRGDDPHVVRFHSDALRTGWAYRVALETPASCGAVKWRGASRGIVTAGTGATFRFDALSMRTRVEIKAERGGEVKWLTADRVTASAPAREFRVVTDLPDVTHFDLQVSFDRFDLDALTSASTCESPAPAATLRVPRSLDGAASFATIDLATVLADSPTHADPVSVARRKLARAGAPIYVRAVPVREVGKACDPKIDGGSSWALVSVVPDPPMLSAVTGPAVDVTGAFNREGPPTDLVEAGYTCFRVVTPHTLPAPTAFPTDLVGAILASTPPWYPGYVMQPGEGMCWPPASNDDPWYVDVAEGFGDAIGTLLDPIEWLVNQAAAIYQEIKAKAVDLVAYALAATVGCDETCRSALVLGLEVGLVAMGLPPSLPDFDALAEEGLGYLANELAAQTGVPAPIAAQALELAGRAVEEGKRRRGSAFIPWAVEDTFHTPVVLHLTAKRGNLLKSVEPQAYVWNWLYQGVVIDMRLNAGGGAVRIPIVLPVDPAGLAPLPPIAEVFGVKFFGSPQRAKGWFERQSAERAAKRSCHEYLISAGCYGACSSIEFVESLVHVRMNNTDWNEWKSPNEWQCSL